MRPTPMVELRPLTPRIYFSGLYTGIAIGLVLGAGAVALLIF